VADGVEDDSIVGNAVGFFDGLSVSAIVGEGVGDHWSLQSRQFLSNGDSFSSRALKNSSLSKQLSPATAQCKNSYWVFALD